MPLYSAQLPKRICQVIPLVVPRLKEALKYHRVSVYTFGPDGTLITVKMDAARVEVIADVAGKIIERLMLKGIIGFQGFRENIDIRKKLRKSVVHIVSSSYEGKTFLLSDVKELVACMLMLYLIRQYAIIPTPGISAPVQKRRATLSLPRPTNASLH
jgi:hypothetical protein